MTQSEDFTVRDNAYSCTSICQFSSSGKQMSDGVRSSRLTGENACEGLKGEGIGVCRERLLLWCWSNACERTEGRRTGGKSLRLQHSSRKGSQPQSPECSCGESHITHKRTVSGTPTVLSHWLGTAWGEVPHGQLTALLAACSLGGRPEQHTHGFPSPPLSCTDPWPHIV